MYVRVCPTCDWSFATVVLGARCSRNRRVCPMHDHVCCCRRVPQLLRGFAAAYHSPAPTYPVLLSIDLGTQASSKRYPSKNCMAVPKHTHNDSYCRRTCTAVWYPTPHQKGSKLFQRVEKRQQRTHTYIQTYVPTSLHTFFFVVAYG